MKCPYCGVHCTDSERQCPVCGRRMDPLKPENNSKSTNSNFDMPYEASKEEEPSSPQEGNDTAKTSDSAAWQKSAAGSDKNPYTPQGQNRQTADRSIGCLIAFIIMCVIIALIVVGALLSYNTLHTTTINTTDVSSDSIPEGSATTETEDVSDDIYEICEVSDVLAGIWVMGDTGLTLIIQTDGTVMWTDNQETAEDENPLCERLLLDSSNADEYCTDEDLERFPIDQYTYYTLYATDASNELDEIHLLFYLPNDQEPNSLTSVECYDCNTEEYYTFTRTDGEVPNEPVEQDA